MKKYLAELCAFTTAMAKAKSNAFGATIVLMTYLIDYSEIFDATTDCHFAKIDGKGNEKTEKSTKGM